MAEPKVVGIHGGKTVLGANVKPLPKALISIRDNFRAKLQSFLRHLFDGADDALFEMIDKAGTSAEQELYFDAMRELRLQKRQIATTVVKDMLVGFNTLQNSTPDQNGRKGDHLASLDLIEKEDLEVSVAVEAMINRVNSDAGADLLELSARVAKIAGSADIGLKGFPASPFSLCQSFVKASEKLDFSIRARLIVLKLFERYLLTNLPAVYQQVNKQLKQAGVLPNLVLGNKNRAEANGQKVPKEAPANDVKAASDDVPVLAAGQYVSSGLPFNELCSLLHSARSYEKVEITNAIPQSNVIQLLSYNQNLVAEQPVGEGSFSRSDFKTLITESPQAPSNSSLSHADSDTISLISMLFDFILDDRQLQPVMKALIARLQIPILKVAMLDRSFFDRGGHPARKLLNEMATAALGWSEGKDLKSDRLRAKLEEVVSKILTEFDNDVSVFEGLLADFSKFIFLENKRGKLVEQRTKDAEAGKALFDVAQKEVDNVIATILRDKKSRGIELPESIVRFLSEAWKGVLNYAYLNGGTSSDRWKDYVGLVKDLVWTGFPNSDEYDVRSELVKKIPGVIRLCRQGLKLISFDEFKTKELLDDIQKTHVSVLNNLQTYEQFEKPSKEDEAAAELIEDTLAIEKDFSKFAERKLDASVDSQSDVGELNANEVDEQDPFISVAENTDTELQGFLKQIDCLSMGTWFELAEGDSKERCKLAAYISAIDKYIFVNRSGIKVLERDKLGFASMLKEGRLVILSDSLLFDRALESVIGSLRGAN